MNSIEMQIKVLPIFNSSIVIPKKEVITYYYKCGSFDLKKVLKNIYSDFRIKLDGLTEINYAAGVTFYAGYCSDLRKKSDVELIAPCDIAEYVPSYVSREAKKMAKSRRLGKSI